MIEKLNYISQRGNISPTNTNGSGGSIMYGIDLNQTNQDKINEIIDAVNQLSGNPKQADKGMDANVILEIIKENNAQWMKLLEFMRDMKEIKP